MLERPEFSKTAGKLSLGLHGKFQLWMVSPIQKKWWCSLIFQLAICGRKSKSPTPLRSYSTSPERQRSNEKSGEYDDDSYGASHAWRWKKTFCNSTCWHCVFLRLVVSCYPTMGVERDFLVFFGVEGKNFNLNGKIEKGSMSEPRCYLYNDYNIIYQYIYISYKSIYTLYIHISLHINTYCTNQNLSGTTGDFNSWYTSFLGPLKQRAFLRRSLKPSKRKNGCQNQCHVRKTAKGPRL